MSSEVASSVAHRVLLSKDTQSPGDDEHNDVMERIPVEIWREILLICIACPLLIHRYGDQYHEILISGIDCDLVAKYKQSERIRKRLRLVCQDWNQFLEEHSDRLVQLTPRVRGGYWPPVKRWDRVVRIDGPTYTRCSCDELCWPPSLHGDDQMPGMDSLSPIERSTIRDHLTRLGERCKEVSLPGFWRDELAEQPGLRSVTMLKENFLGQNYLGIRISALSNAYQKLTYLEIFVPTINDPSVGLELPFLTMLRLGVRGSRVLDSNASNSATAGGAIGTWTLPNINFLDFDMLSASEGEIDAFNLLLGQVGRTLSTMIIGNHQGRGCTGFRSIFDADIWSSLPALNYLGIGSTDLLRIPGPSRGSGGLLIDLGLDTTGMWFSLGLAENLARVFATKWSSSTLGNVKFDILWERAVLMKGLGLLSPSYLALFDVLHHTGRGLTDSAGMPFDSTIRDAFLDRTHSVARSDIAIS